MAPSCAEGHHLAQLCGQLIPVRKNLMWMEGYMGLDSLPEPNLFLRLSENFDLRVLQSCWKSFSCAPSFLVFPQNCCHGLRLLVGWAVGNMFLCCMLWAPSQGGRCLTTAVLQQPHLAFSTLIQLLLSACFGSAPKWHFKQQTSQLLIQPFCIYILRATLRPRCSHCVVAHTQ